MQFGDRPWGVALRALGAGFQGGDPSGIIKGHRDEMERAERKEHIQGLLQDMSIAGPEREFLASMPVDAAQAYLANHFQHERDVAEQMRREKVIASRQAASRAAAEAERQRVAAAEEAQRQASIDAFMGYTRPTPGSNGPTIEAANSGLSRDAVARAMMDPRLTPAMREQLVKAYQFQNPAADERRIVKGADGRNYYADSAEPVLPGVVAPDVPLSPAGKLAADLSAGRITPEQYEAATTKTPLVDMSNANFGGQLPDLTVEQGKNTGFYIRTQDANRTLNELENQGTEFVQQNLENVPFGLGNFGRSEDFQRFDQARRDFVNAILRRESGAVISEQEFDNANKQYFPIPGDSDAVIEQKRRNRENAIEGLRIGSAEGSQYVDQKSAAELEGVKTRLRADPEIQQFLTKNGLTFDEYWQFHPDNPDAQ